MDDEEQPATTTVKRRVVTWFGDVPATCQISGRAITTEFVDGSVPGHRSWAIMHPVYFRVAGGTFGTGRGQRYAKQDDGRWLKVEG